MQPFQIFRPGKHTAASGVTLEFNEDLLRGAVAAYDPELHQAPIVVGHPKDNHPAYGWVNRLDFDESGHIIADPEQVDPDFAEMVAAGRFKKRSASWYLPDSPNNPKPGTLYLRHVGFLGAQPPAIKGLKDVAFSEEDGVIEFVEGSSSPWAWTMLSSVFRGLREMMIADKGIEAADKVIPTYYIDELKAEGERKDRELTMAAAAPAPVAAISNYNEGQPMLTPEQIAALQAENETLKAAAAQAADFAEKQGQLEARERALAIKELGVEIDALVTAGKVLPAQKAGLCEFMASLDDAETSVEFGEGDQTKKISPRQFMRDFLVSMPKLVDFQERAPDQQPNGANLEGQELANRAVEYRESMKAKGVEISVTDAVNAVRAGKASE